MRKVQTISEIKKINGLTPPLTSHLLPTRWQILEAGMAAVYSKRLHKTKSIKFRSGGSKIDGCDIESL